MNAHLGQALRHFFGSFAAATTGIAQTLNQVLMGMVKAQPHNVDRFASKGD
jgi:hypothetical protein